MGPRAAAVLGTQQVFFAVIATTADARRGLRAARPSCPARPAALFREFGFVAGHLGRRSRPWWRCRSARCWPRACWRDGSATTASSRGLIGRVRRRARAALPPGCCTPRSTRRWSCWRSARSSASPPAACSPAIQPGADPDRGPLGRAAAGHRAAGRQPRLYARASCARSRSCTAAAARLRRGDRALFSIAGQGGADNSGFMVFTLAPWDERERAASRRSSPTSPGRGGR